MKSGEATTSDYEIRLAGSDDLPRVETMWLALYEHQQQNGMLLEIPPSGFDQWATSLKPVLGRFACLFVAELGGAPAGFLAGRIRALPSYFGGEYAGFVSEVYVADAHRQQGVGRRLVTTAMDWFQAQGIKRVELQVVMNNAPARQLYRQLGWKEELVQMVWTPSTKDANA